MLPPKPLIGHLVELLSGSLLELLDQRPRSKQTLPPYPKLRRPSNHPSSSAMMKELAEDAENEKALKDVTVDIAKEKAKAADVAEKKAKAAKKA